MFRLFQYFALFALVVSCSDFNFKKTDQVQLLENEKMAIDWNSVDNWPTFESCEGNENIQSRIDCITSTIQLHCEERFKQNDLRQNDTLWVKLNVSNNGAMAMTFVQEADSLLVSVLEECASSLPKMIPALKRGQPVNCELRLPLIFRTLEVQ